MSRPLSYDEKMFIENKVKEGFTSQQIANELGRSKKVVDKWRQRLKKMEICCLN